MSENEKKVETETVEETPADEVETKEQNTNTTVELTKYTNDETPYSQVVEEARKVLFKDSKKQNTLSFVSMIIVFVILIAGFFLFTINQIVAFVLIGIAAAVLIGSSILVKRICRPDVHSYIKTASTAINRYVFNDTKFSECVYDPNAKIVFGEICEDGVYSKMKECVSRDVVTGKYLGRSFKAAELGIYKEMVKRTKPTAFVGKYLTYPNDLHFVGRIVIVSKGGEDVDIPDGVSDLHEIKIDNKLIIYAEDEKVVSDNISKKFLDAIKAISVREHLLTLCVVIWAGRSIVYASYDDASVTLPFDKEINTSCYDQYRNDVTKELDALNMLLGE